MKDQLVGALRRAAAQLKPHTRTEEPAASAPVAAADPEPAGPSAPTLVRAPLDGEVIDLSQVADPAFSHRMVGPGLALRPTSTTVVSPVDGHVMLLFPTRHAVGIASDTGVEVLVHVGLDTVRLKGKGFTAHVHKGETVAVGAPLITFDPQVIEEAGFSLVTPVIVTNSRTVGEPVLEASGDVAAGDPLFRLG